MRVGTFSAMAFNTFPDAARVTLLLNGNPEKVLCQSCGKSITVNWVFDGEFDWKQVERADTPPHAGE